MANYLVKKTLNPVTHTILGISYLGTSNILGWYLHVTCGSKRNAVSYVTVEAPDKPNQPYNISIVKVKMEINRTSILPGLTSILYVYNFIPFNSMIEQSIWRQWV